MRRTDDRAAVAVGGQEPEKLRWHVGLLIGADEKWPQGVVVAAIDPVVELRCRRIDLSGFGEQVRDLLLRGDDLVVEFCGQPQAAALCDRGHLGVESDSGRVAGRPLLW